MKQDLDDDHEMVTLTLSKKTCRTLLSLINARLLSLQTSIRKAKAKPHGDPFVYECVYEYEKPARLEFGEAFKNA